MHDFLLKKRIVKECQDLGIPEQYTLVYNEIKQFLKDGNEEILNYLSTSYDKDDFNDNMLNCDNIYHFHFTKKGQRRDNERLFVYITLDVAYIIGLYQHGSEKGRVLDRYIKLYNDYPDLFDVRKGRNKLDNEKIKYLKREFKNIEWYPLDDENEIRLKNRGYICL